MKSTLLTTPYKGSHANFALDAQRELNHQDVLKAFRSGANITSVIPRMSFIDTLNEIHELTIRNPSVYNESEQEEKLQEELLGLKISPTDIKYILRMTSLILRRGGISTETNQTVFMYTNHLLKFFQKVFLMTQLKTSAHTLLKSL
jgi:hypothetical protein